MCPYLYMRRWEEKGENKSRRIERVLSRYSKCVHAKKYIYLIYTLAWVRLLYFCFFNIVILYIPHNFLYIYIRINVWLFLVPLFPPSALIKRFKPHKYAMQHTRKFLAQFILNFFIAKTSKKKINCARFFFVFHL